jgi:hypothetical protein
VYDAVAGLLLQNGHGQMLNTSAEAAAAVAVIQSIYAMAGRTFTSYLPGYTAVPQPLNH